MSRFRLLLPWQVGASEEGEQGTPEPDDTPGAAPPKPRLGVTAWAQAQQSQSQHEDQAGGEASANTAPGALPHAVTPIGRALFRDDESRREAMAALMRLICMLQGRSQERVRGLTIVPPAPNPLRLRLTLEIGEAGLSVLVRSELDASRRAELQQVLHVLETMLRERLAPMPVRVTLLS